MGANGCEWGFMGVAGCRGTDTQQNKVSRGKNRQTGHVFWFYGRGNFPERHVFFRSGVEARKYMQIHDDGFRWVQ